MEHFRSRRVQTLENMCLLQCSFSKVPVYFLKIILIEYDQEHTKKYTECMLNQFRAVWESIILFFIIIITLISIPRLRFLQRTMEETMCYCLKTKEMLSIIEPQSQFQYAYKKKTCNLLTNEISYTSNLALRNY